MKIRKLKISNYFELILLNIETISDTYHSDGYEHIHVKLDTLLMEHGCKNIFTFSKNIIEIPSPEDKLNDYFGMSIYNEFNWDFLNKPTSYSISIFC